MMANTYTITVTDLETRQTDSLQNVVSVVDFSVTATNEQGQTGTVHSCVGLTDPDPDAFVDYGNLTESTVLSWVINRFPSDDMDTLKSMADGQVNKQQPVRGLPWQS